MISGSVYFGLALTCGAYVVGCVVHRFAKTPLLNPLIVTNVLVIAFLALTGIAYDDYFNGAKYIGDLLTPATVCLAIPLYRQLHLLKKHAAAICCGIAAGVLANSLCILLMSLLFGFSRTMYVTLLPKSITAAIAMPVCEELGGIPAITMLATVITGAFGYISAPALLKLVRVGEKTPGVVDLTRLLGRQRRTLHMVRVVRHEHLRPIEQRVVDPRVPLVPEPVHKPRPVGHGVLPSLRKHRRGIRVRANRRT